MSPSFEHEVLVAIVREHPEVILTLLGGAYRLDASDEIEVLAAPESLGTLRPIERRADAVLVVRERGSARARAALVIEVQLQPDARKRFSWPVYVAVARARLACPVSLVVVALDAATAQWCAAPIELDGRGSVLLPRVLGSAQLPPVDVDGAQRHPELAVLSLIAHRDEPVALSIARAILACVDRLDAARAELYTDIVFDFLNAAARRALEAEMNLENYEPRSEFLRNLKSKCMAEGRAEGLAAALFKVLESRGLALSDDQRATIHACSDPDVLGRWIARAATASEPDALFADDR